MEGSREPRSGGLVIGLIGGIGSGKSSVAAMLAELGAHVIHADAVGHEVYQSGTPGWAAVVHAFGRDIVSADGSIDRKRLGAVVFADPTALQRLNAIVHPLIGEAIQHRIAHLRLSGSPTPIVVEAAILIEAGWRSLVDEVWLVVAPQSAVEERLRAQRSMASDEVRRRIAAQLSDDQRRIHSQVVIENDGSLEALRTQVAAAWKQLVDASR